ncbi:hypothetical protein [Catellatospora sp. NPDC049609]|uniref:hypothetical protein n=1 Tax=Catellatospora sp. NPDC049609 TaxID=3155505 RepID=UPI00344318F7
MPETSGDDELRSALGGPGWPSKRWERASHLMKVARDGRPEQRAVALEALAGASAAWWTVLDETLRSQTWTVQRWTNGLVEAVAAGRADLLDLVVAGCHHQGRLREAAVARLRGHAHPVAAAMLALRSADWVDPVRDAAREACEHLLDERIDAPRLLAVAGLADALGERVRGRWLRERVDALVPRLPDETRSQLLRSGHRDVRRNAYRLAIAAGRLPVDRLVDAALRDADLVIRRTCADAAFAAAADLSVARRLLAARTPLIRSEAVRLLARGGERTVARAALADRSPLVRLVAQVAVGRAGGDPAAYYRELLAGACPAPGAIAGLGETGTSGDVDLIARWLAHPSARGRVEAVRALVARDAVRAEPLLPLLHDPANPVVAQAAAALSTVAHEISPALLRELLDPAQRPAVRRAAYRLVLVRDVWLGLTVGLRLLADADPVLGAQARAEVAAWPRNPGPGAYRRLTPEVAPELLAAIEQARPVLGDSRTELLRWCVRQDR